MDFLIGTIIGLYLVACFYHVFIFLLIFTGRIQAISGSSKQVGFIILRNGVWAAFSILPVAIFYEINPLLGVLISFIVFLLAYFSTAKALNKHLVIFRDRPIYDIPYWFWRSFNSQNIASLDAKHDIDFSPIANDSLIYSEALRKEIVRKVTDWVNDRNHPTAEEFIAATASVSVWDLNTRLSDALEKKNSKSLSIEDVYAAVRLAQDALPNTKLLAVSCPGMSWGKYILPEGHVEGQPYYDPFSQLPEELASRLKGIEFKIALPQKLRVEHHHIVAPTGHGKTTLLQSMILDDIATDASVILIDSDGGIIENLLRVIDPERMVLIDPTDIEFPVALNLFDVGWDRIEQYSPLEREMATNGVLELFDFVMASLLGADLTSKQSTAFRYVTRLMMTVPGATILDFLKLFEPGGLEPYRDYIDDMGETAQSFFNNEFEGSEFKATKKQILRRLYGLLENQTFARMFSNPKTKLNIFDEMSQGKIILINTAKNLLKADASQIMGRFFIAMIAQAAQERSSQKDRRRTYFYIDEADEYFDDTMITILAKARKYELGLIIAHQFLGQLPSKLFAALAANTAIKFAGGKTVSDATAMSKLMFTTPNRIQDLPVGTFLAYVKGHEAFPYVVPEDPFAGRKLATDVEMEDMRELMRERYAYPASDLKKPKTVRTPKADPDDVEEASTW